MQVEDEVSVCGKIMFGGEEEKLWPRWQSVEEVKKGGSKGKGERENSFFVVVVFHSLVFLSKSTLSGSTTQNMNGYIYKN